MTMWSVAENQMTASFRGENGELFVRSALSRDGKLLVAANRAADVDGIVVWDVASRKILKSMSVSRQAIVDVAFSGDGEFLACACTDGVFVFDTTDWQRLVVLAVSGQFFSVAFHPVRPLLAVPDSYGSSVRIWDVVGNREVATLHHPGNPHSVSFSANGDTLASVTGWTVHHWNVRGGKERQVFSAHHGIVNRVAFSPNGKLLASSGRDGIAKLWDMMSGSELSSLSISETPLANIPSVRFDSSGTKLGLVDWDGGIAVFDISNPRRPVKEFEPSRRELVRVVWDIAFSSDGKMIAAAGVSGVKVWRDGTLMATPFSGEAYSLQFSPDGKRLAWSEVGHGALHVWNVDSGKIEKPWSLEQTMPGGIHFHPDSRHLMSFAGSSEDQPNWPIIVDIQSGEQRKLAWQPQFASMADNEFRKLPFDRNGLWFDFVGNRPAVRDSHNGELLLILPHDSESIQSWDSSSEPMRIALAMSDGRVVVWNLAAVHHELAFLGLDW